jgi:hypothetical protein
MNLIRKIQQLSQKKEHLDANFRKSYSQCGEDMIVDYVFRLRGIAKTIIH